MKTRRSPRNQERLYRAIGRDLSEAALRSRLFAGIYPCGIVYADRSNEEAGDYKRVAFLVFRTLELEVSDPRSPLLPMVRTDAAEIQARRGELFEVSGAGQTVRLGGYTP